MRGCSTHEQLSLEMQRARLKALCLADAAGLGLRTNPGLSCPRVAGGVEVPLPLGRRHLRAKGKGVQGFLLFSERPGRV